MTPFGLTLRLQRLHRHDDTGLLVVPLDHTITTGPIGGGRDVAELLGEITTNGADAVVLHKGRLRHIPARSFVDTALIVHLSAGTAAAPDPDARCLVGGVEEALRYGADAVSVHLNLGAADEQDQLRDIAGVAGAAHRWGVPLLVMAYPRGARFPDPADPAAVAHAVSVAVDLGADLVKTVYPGSTEALAAVTAQCPVPVLVAGGARHDSLDGLLDLVGSAMQGGAGGVAIGRNIFDAAQPGAVTQKVADIVHGHTTRPDTRGARS